MQLILDGIPAKQEVNEGNIIQIVEDYLKKCAKNNRVFTTCRIDGTELDVEDPLEVLRKNLKQRNIKRVEIITQDKYELVEDTIKTVLEYNEKLIPAIRQLATDIYTGEEINRELWQGITGGLEWVISVCMLLDQNFVMLSNKSKSTRETVQNVNTILNEIVQAMTYTDMIAVADLLEYELVEKLEQINNIFKVYISESKLTTKN